MRQTEEKAVAGRKRDLPRTLIQRSGEKAAGRTWVLLALALVAAPAASDGAAVNADRARINYMLNCQGCHLPDGSGVGDIPQMRNFVGNFLKVPGGRAFLVQVPGSANAALSDAALAELLNWMLPEISAAQLPADFDPYTAAEVGRYRAAPLSDVNAVRLPLIRKIALLPGE